MDYWAENQGHLPQYNKFSTVPVRSCGQNFYDRQQTAHYPVYCGDQRDKSMDSGYWPVQDIPNWANPDVNPTSPQYFPFHLDRPIQQHYQDFGEHQEARDWTSFQHNREPERGLQREGWSYSPVRYKRDISKKNESNFRELEAWAMRYSHSLPRRRRIEAELRGTLQGGLPDRLERRELQTPNIRDSTLWERSSNQQAQNYFASPTSQNLDTKDKVSYQTKLFTHPPNYNAPPPYSVQHKNVPTLQRFEKQSYKSQLEQDREMHEKRMTEKSIGNVEAKQTDVLQENSQAQLVQVKPISEAPKIIEGRKFKLNKKAGRMTIFCLVSRIADTERETLPILQTKCEVVDQKSCNVSQTLKLADEVDFKSPVQTSTKHLKSPYSKLKAIPICKTLTDSLSKMADKNVSKVDDASTIGKQAVQAKYPLWRRPSFTSSSETDNMCPAKNANANIQGKESGSNSCGEIETESVKVHKEAKNNDAMLMIDTTCVVIKMEVLQAPIREQVHYLSSSKTSENYQNLVSDSVQCKGDSQPKRQDNENVDQLDILEMKSEENSMYVLEKAKSEVKQQTNSEFFENSEDRAKRIIGLIESTTEQLDKEEIGDLDVEVQDPPKTNKVTNDLHGEEGNEELQLDLVADKIEDLCQFNGCKDKRTDYSAGIVELDAIERDNKEKDGILEIVEIIGNLLHETKDVEDPSGDVYQATEIDPTMDISDTLELRKEPDNAILLTTSEERLSPLQFHVQEDSVQTATNLTQTEVEDIVSNIVSLSAKENSGTPPLTSLIDPKNDHLDKAFTEEVSQRDFEDENQVNEQVHGELGVSNMAESKSGEKEDMILARKEKSADVTSNKVEMQKISTLKANDLDNVQVESGPKEEASILEELSEIVLKQDLEIIEEVNCKMNGQNMAQFQSSPIDEVSEENLGYSDGGKGIGIITSHLEMHEEAIVKDLEDNTMQNVVESSQIEEEICSEEQSKQIENSDLEIDILVAKVEADKEVELETQKRGQFECQELDNYSNYIKLVAEDKVDESLHSPSLIEPKIEIESECNQNQGNEELRQIHRVSDQVDNISCVVSKDIEITTSDLDIVGDAMVEGDGECGQIQNASIKESLTADEKLEDIDVLDKLHEKATEPCSEVDSEKYVETFAKEVPTYELAKIESPDKLTQEDNDLQEQNEDCEEAQSTACVNDKICDNAKVATENLESQQKTEFAVATNSILQSELQTQPTNNTHISESFGSSLHTCDQSISSISTLSDVFENSERETDEKYPKSLWDAVSRIRKHTAPDSENEEEEVTDNWDRESLADNLGTIDRDGGAFDRDLQYVDEDLERVKEELLNMSFEDGNLQDDKLSQSSNSSQTSEETIVDDELENATMENCELQDLRGAREDHVCDGDSVNKKQVDKCPGEKLEDAEMSEEIML